MFEVIFLLGRILYGGFFVISATKHFTHLSMMAQYAGSKNVPWPKFSVVFSGLFIFFGGLGILFGVYTKLALFLLVVFLFVVSFSMHNFWAIKDPLQKQIEMTNFLKNMALLGAAAMLKWIPEPWPYSLTGYF